MPGSFQPQPVAGNKLVEDDGTPTPVYRKWLDKLAPALSNLPAFGNPPASSTDVATFGLMRTDGTFLYIAVGPNQWKRVALTAF
ncbi:MAG: hypothetical protein ACRD20_20455 [Terriglobales bacterium]